MSKLEEVEPLLKACLENAVRLVESAKAVASVHGCNHIAYHLAVLALEEIGKSHPDFSGIPRSQASPPRSR